jgi:hypothetical protein
VTASPLQLRLFISGAWQTFPAYSEAGWTAQIGPDVETGNKPNKITARLADPIRRLDPYNPASTLYGLIGRNTKCALNTTGGDITQAEMSSWKAGETTGYSGSQARGIAYQDIVAEGLLRRLGRWDTPIASAETRQITSYAATLSGLWPLEDQSASPVLSNRAPGGSAGKYTGTVSLAADPGAGGSDKCLTIGSDGHLDGYFLIRNASGYQLLFQTKLAAVPGSATNLAQFSWNDTQGRVWQWQVNSTGYTISVVAGDGTVLVSSAVGGTAALNQWIRYRMKVTVSGGTITYEPAWYTQDTTTTYGVSGTFSGTVAGQPRQWYVDGNTHTNGAAYSHVFSTTDTTVDFLGGASAIGAFNGYLNEPAIVRFNRLMAEEGLQAYTDGNALVTVPMGRQRPGVFLDLLQECVTTDGALLYDEPNDVALTVRIRATQINRTAELTLPKTAIVFPLDRTTDDVGVVNSITVTNSDGTSVTAELASGNLSVQPPPAGVGRYKGGGDLTVNLADSRNALTNRAYFELAKGTVDRPRYEQVTVDLFANPSYRAAVVALRPGAWITLTGVEADPVTLRVIQIQRAGIHLQDAVTFNCLPADVYRVARSDNTADLTTSLTTTLAAAATSTATVLQLTTDDPRDTWSTTSATGYDLLIAGERIGVPVGGMSAAAGTGPYTQTITGAVRSKNGIVKAQLSGAPVGVASPVRFGL